MPSTVIGAFSYDPVTSILKVTYVSGIIYEYKDVPENIYNEMKASPAKGIFLNKNIKNKFRFEKVN